LGALDGLPGWDKYGKEMILIFNKLTDSLQLITLLLPQQKTRLFVISCCDGALKAISELF
jgi:hypothetical protein